MALFAYATTRLCSSPFSIQSSTSVHVIDMNIQESLNPNLSGGRSRPSVQFATGRNSSPSSHSARALSGLYSSSAASIIRSDEENLIVLEIGSRFLRAGFAGESKPRAIRSFGPDEHRRVGDYRPWMPGYANTRRKRRHDQEWAEDYELWNMDLRNVDLGLVEDKIERAIRETSNSHLLLDHRPRRATIAVSTQLPRPLLTSLLDTVFTALQAVSITLFTTPICNIVSAGIRSGLVIDIGWRETTVTAVYEYREIDCRHSVRAGRYLSEEMAKILNEELKQDWQVTFAEADDELTRMAWCFDFHRARENKEGAVDDTSAHAAEGDNGPIISIPFPTANTSVYARIPFDRFAEPAENALFARNCLTHGNDDHDIPIPQLAYNSLLSIPIDARARCMSRIVITGGPSKIPGVKKRILQEVEHLVDRRGWDSVRNYGSATQRRAGQPSPSLSSRGNSVVDILTPLPSDPSSGDGISANAEQQLTQDHNAPQTPGSQSISSAATGPATPFSASGLPQEYDPIAAKRQELNSKDYPVGVQGVVRGVETLGAWAGANLLAQRRIPGVYEYDKDRFRLDGLTPVAKDSTRATLAKRKKHGSVSWTPNYLV